MFHNFWNEKKIFGSLNSRREKGKVREGESKCRTNNTKPTECESVNKDASLGRS